MRIAFLALLLLLTIPRAARADILPDDWHTYTPQQKYDSMYRKWQWQCEMDREAGRPCGPPPNPADYGVTRQLARPASCLSTPGARSQVVILVAMLGLGTMAVLRRKDTVSTCAS